MMGQTKTDNIVSVFLDVAAKYPNNVAVRYSENGIWYSQTYRELAESAEKVAANLIKAGVQPGDAAIIVAERSKFLCADLLGVLWSGAYYVLLDDKYPLERKQLICREVEARWGVIHESSKKLEGIDIAWVDSDSDIKEDACNVYCHREMAAQAIFTSGSTGTPKGVLIPHRGVVRLVTNTNYIDFSSEQTFLQLSSLSFDASTLEIWGALLNGGCCVLYPEGSPITYDLLQDVIVSQNVSTAWLTSSLYNAVISEQPEVLTGLQQLLIGGEALSVPHVRRGLEILRETKIYNGYGPTENTTFTTIYPIPNSLPRDLKRIPIGYSINATKSWVFDEKLKPVQVGVEGELIAFGDGVALGYINRPELNLERFVDVICPDGEKRKGYRTGDLVFQNDDGCFEYLGRNDKQVKIDGHRIEPSEIENIVNQEDFVSDARVVLKTSESGQKRLASYVVFEGDDQIDRLRKTLTDRLPAYMVPHFIIPLSIIPLTQNGKLDESALPNPFTLSHSISAEQTDVSSCWQKILGRRVSIDTNFMEAGGTSLEGIQLTKLLGDNFSRNLPPTFIFEYSTISSQEKYLTEEYLESKESSSKTERIDDIDIAVIGMACRVPGASNVEQFWDNLLKGEESITFFKPEELDASIPSKEKYSSRYVPAKGLVDDADLFDAEFFSIPPREAEILDPQQRIMLELSWHALENAGYVLDGSPCNVGVFVGCDWPRYFRNNIQNNPSVLDRFGEFNASLANEHDFLATRISYKLNLTGPSVNVATACSTGLVSIVNAISALNSSQCNVALAGGISISTPLNSGYTYQEGGMLSVDGHTRTFDESATGTTFNDGAGLVVLKRLRDAERDGDHIYAVLKGGAINNDGAVKASFTAPSVAGQVDVYRAAITKSGVNPSKVGFIETHGTATPIGDPIEIESLKRVYDVEENQTESPEDCFLGAVKSNIGHTIHAAGVIGLIKTVKVVEEGKIPAVVHFKTPNPNLRIENSRFCINSKLTEWNSNNPRLAAVSSLGVGGTNAHVLVQEYHPKAIGVVDNVDFESSLPLLISAKNNAALQQQIENYCQWMKANSDSLAFSDFAWANSVFKSHFAFRAVITAGTFENAISQLESRKHTNHLQPLTQSAKKVVFLFTGQGSQRINMGADLYSSSDLYRRIVDDGIEFLKQLSESEEKLNHLVALRQVMFSDEADSTIDEARINETRFSQPALFLFEYALAKYLTNLGCSPNVFIGHSVGEWVAAALAGVFTFKDALLLVAYRGYLMQSMEPGSMLSVQCDAELLKEICKKDICVAAHNAPGVYVFSGKAESIEDLSSMLDSQGIPSRLLVTSHAFHSSMMEPMVEEFRRMIEGIERKPLNSNQVTFISTVTGQELTNDLIQSSEYWANQVRQPVKFSDALSKLKEKFEDETIACIEVGPGDSLYKLLLRHQFYRDKNERFVGFAAQPGFGKDSTSDSDLAKVFAGMWGNGFDVNWAQFYAEMYPAYQFKRVKLPRYSFLRNRHWISAPKVSDFSSGLPTATPTNEPIFALNCNNRVETPMSNEQHIIEVQNKIRSILEDVSGYDLSDVEPDVHFAEAGLDSLLLTQAALAIEKQYGGGVTFRMLAETYTDLSALANHMSEHIPVENTVNERDGAVSSSVPSQVSTDVLPIQPGQTVLSQLNQLSVSGSVSDNDTAVLIQSQLQLMQMQLQLMSGNAATNQQLNPSSLSNKDVSSTAQSVSTKPQKDPQTPAAKDDSQISEVTKNAMRMTRISREVVGANLTSAQQKWIDKIMSDFQEKFAESKRITQQHRKYFSDPRSVSGFNPSWKEIVFPMVINKSKGSKIWDVSGNEFIDIVNGFGPILFGHLPDFIMDAVKAQFDDGIETGPQHPLAGEVANLVCEITENERCAYANTGSEAMACALRMVRTATGKDTVVMFEGSYHGIFDEMVARPGANQQGMPLAPGIPRSALNNVKVLPWGDVDSLSLLREMDDVAAILVETVQSRNPKIQDREYIQKIREMADEIDAALIFDEVVTGFRVAPGGIQERFGVKADMVTYGKILGGGFPIGLVAGKAKYLDALDGGYWEFGNDSIPEAGVTFFAGTFLRHPAALAAAKQVLLKIKADGGELYRKLDAKTERLAIEVNKTIKRLECDISLDHFSSMFYVKVPTNAQWGHLLYKLMLLEGVHIVQNAGSFLTTEHTEEDIDRIIAAFNKSISLLVANGLVTGNLVEANKLLSKKGVIPDGARLGKNAQGEPAYFIEDENKPGKFIEVGKP